MSSFLRSARLGSPAFAVLFVAGVLAGVSGCERKERVIDIKAPGVSIEVDRDKDSGRVDVDVDAGRDRR